MSSTDYEKVLLDKISQLESENNRLWTELKIAELNSIKTVLPMLRPYQFSLFYLGDDPIEERCKVLKQMVIKNPFGKHLVPTVVDIEKLLSTNINKLPVSHEVVQNIKTALAGGMNRF